MDDDSHLPRVLFSADPRRGLGYRDAPAYPQPMAPTIRARRLAYRIAAQLLRLLRPLVPIDWGGVKCVLTDGDQVLLVRHTYGSRLWDLPGGGRHRGERPIDAARREMHEELGLEIDDWRALGRLHARTERHRQTIDVYGAELSSPTLRAGPRRDRGRRLVRA